MTPPLSPPQHPRRAPTARSASFGLALLLSAGIVGAEPALSQPDDPQSGQRGTSDRRANWPQWRGPSGTGIASYSDAPVRFSAAEGVAWRVEIPGRGQSSPVVWDDLVFVTTAVPVAEQRTVGDRPRRRRSRLVEHEFRLIAVRRVDGSLAWSRTATTATPHERYHRTLSSYANASPVTDGRRVYAFFGSRGLYAYDLQGEPLWERDFDVEMQTFGEFGEGSSPALHGDTVVVTFDHQGQSFIEALDSATGETRWKQLRDEDTSWSSPYIVEHEGRALVIASGGKFITAYDLSSGEVAWQSPGMTPHPIPTPVAGAGLLFVASGSTERRVLAIELGADGAVAWRLDKAAPYNPSPLLWDDELYLVRDGGLNAGTSRVSLVDARTGEPHYLQKRLPGPYTVKASPVGAGEHVYLATEEGDILVLRRGPEFEVVAVNPMEEPFIATPAIAHGDLYLRGRTHLFRITHDAR